MATEERKSRRIERTVSADTETATVTVAAPAGPTPTASPTPDPITVELRVPDLFKARRIGGTVYIASRNGLKQFKTGDPRAVIRVTVSKG